MRMTHKQSGFTLVEMIMTMLIIAILAGLGSRLLSDTFHQYFTMRDLNKGLTQNNLVFDRIFNGYLEPATQTFLKPLYRSSDGSLVVYATSNTLFEQALEEESTYISQLIKVEHIASDGSLHIVTYAPPDMGSDTLNVDTTDFLSVTNNAAAAGYATDTSIANDVDAFVFTYFDFSQLATLNKNTVAHIEIKATLTRNNVTRERAIVIIPWRLLWISVP